MPARPGALPPDVFLFDSLPRRPLGPRAFWGVALLIVTVGALLRVHGHDWDRRMLLHPDERHMAMVTDRARLPTAWRAFWNGHLSPLNPRPAASFAYGTLPVTVTRLASELRGDVDVTRTADTGRYLSAAADLFTLLLVGWLARRLAGDGAGLLAAACYALAVLPIQHAHFFVVDSFLTAACTLSVAGLVLAHEGRGWRGGLLTGVGVGLAVSCKISGAALVMPAFAVLASQAWQAMVEPAARRDWRRWVWLPVAVLAALLTVRVAAPDMFVGMGVTPSGAWLRDMAQIARFTRGQDWPPAHQWAGRTALYPWWNLVAWGLGWPLGIVSLVALAEAAWATLADWRHRMLVPVAWTLAVFVTGTAGLVTTMRYLLPAYPMLCVCAAWGLVTLVGAARRRARPRLAAAITLGAALMLACTAWWALAFDNVYRVEHPRLRASRWIYQHVPDGAGVTAEAWDDVLPLPTHRDRSASRYRIVTLPVTEDETPAKLDALLAGLASADFVVLSSDRAALTLVRLPARFPMMARYYAALDDGRLGFDRVAEFTTVPAFGGLARPDLDAEEAFTVYDHPRVRIYRKRAGWDAARAREAIALSDWSLPVRVSAAQFNAAPNLLELPPSRRAALREEGTWRVSAGASGRFAGTPPTGARAVVRWVVAVAIVWLLAWPACAVLFRDAWLRGLLLAPALGLLWVAWVTWMWGSLMPWPVSWTVIAGAVASAGLPSAGLAWPRRGELLAWMSRQRLAIAASVAAVALVFAAGLWLRWANPDLWHSSLGGEKPMDLALLSALVRADRFPPADPWFAGGILNYYYFGHLPVALLSRLTGVEPVIAYNLAVALWWALIAGGAATATATIGRVVAPATPSAPLALAGALVASVAGNLAQWRVIAEWLRDPAMPAHHWFWNASRAIPPVPGEPLPITEFPYFTVLFADLHAHLLSMPWLLALLVLSTQLATTDGPVSRARGWAGTVAIGGLLVAALSMTNTWDVPVAVALLASAIGWRTMRGVQPVGWPSSTRGGLLALAATLLVARAAARPFWAAFGPPAGGVGLWPGSHSPVASLLLVWGPFLLAGLGAAIVVAWTRGPRSLAAGLWWLATLFALGLGQIAATETFQIEGDVGRMNLVFKTYLQVWLIWSAAGVAALALLRERLRASSPRPALRIVDGTAVVLGLAMLAYPVTATGPRLRHRMAPDAPRTLDGSAFLRVARVPVEGATFTTSEDADVIRWLQDHAHGTPVVAEAHTGPYQWSARISSYTGLPTVAGWSVHVSQQRQALPGEIVRRHIDDLGAFFTTPSDRAAAAIARRYDIRYVVVGRQERHLYPADGLDKFARSADWREVMRSGETRVYARRW